MVKKQLSLFSAPKPGTKRHLIEVHQSYGGALKHRKYQRPFSKTKAVHIILRSRLLTGSRSLLRSNRKLWTQELLQKKAKKYGAKLYSFSVNSNHLHLVMKFSDSEKQGSFLRDFSGSLALKIKKAFQIAKGIKIWDERPFSQIVKSYPAVIRYIEKNKNEASGLWPYQERPLSYLVKALAKLQERRFALSNA